MLQRARRAEGEPFDTEVVEDSDERPGRARRSNARAAWRSTHRLPAELFEHHDYRKFAEVHAALLKQVGRPPFEVALGERTQRGALLRRRCAARCSSWPATASS